MMGFLIAHRVTPNLRGPLFLLGVCSLVFFPDTDLIDHRSNNETSLADITCRVFSMLVKVLACKYDSFTQS